MLERPLHTERLTLRPATAGDADLTWRLRQLESVTEWLTGGRADLDAYRKLFSETARLTTTVIVTLGHDATAPLIGDFMLRRENAWAQLDVADQARDTQALHREKGGLRAPALLRRHCASEGDHTAFPALRGGCFIKRSKLRCINRPWDTTMPGPPETSV